MPNILDSLLVEVGLDATKYDQGRRKVDASFKKTREDAKKTATDLEAYGKQGAAFFAKLRNEAIMFVGVLAGAAGVKSFGENMIHQARALGFMSQALDMNTRRVQAWQRAAREAGATGQDATNQLTQSQNAIALRRRGLMPEDVRQFFFFGGNGDVRNMTPEQYLLARMQVVQRLRQSQGVGVARMAAQQMGISDSLFNLSLEGNSRIQSQLSRFGRQAIFTDSDEKNANRLTNSLINLQNEFQAIGVRLGVALMPYLERFMAWLKGITDWINGHQDTIKHWIDTAVTSVKSFWQEVNKAIDAVGGWKTVIIALLGLKVLSAVAPLLALAAALLAVGKSLGLISLGAAAIGVIGGAVAVVTGSALAAIPNDSIRGDDSQELKALRGKTPANVRDAQMRAVAFFQRKGLTREQAIGLVANLTAESSMNPQARKGNAFGLAQWMPERQAAFNRVFGFDIHRATEEQQLAFVWWELNHGESAAGNALRGAANNQVAADIVLRKYERPDVGDDARDSARRRGIAGQLFSYMDTHADPTLPVFRTNTVNTLNAATGQYTSAPVTNNTATTEMHVNGPVTINTQATDAKGILVGLSDHFARSALLATQANTGVQ